VFSNNLTTSTPGRATISDSQLGAGFQLTSPLTIKGQDANTTYTIGNVSITNNNPAVTAVSSTFWLTQLFVGQTIQFASQPATNYTILTINSNTSITLTGNYTGTTSANTILTAITPNGTTSAGGPVFIQGGAASNNGTIGVRGSDVCERRSPPTPRQTRDDRPLADQRAQRPVLGRVGPLRPVL